MTPYQVVHELSQIPNATDTTRQLVVENAIKRALRDQRMRYAKVINKLRRQFSRVEEKAILSACIKAIKDAS